MLIGFSALIYFDVLTALWLPMVEQIFCFLTCEMLELLILELFHSVVTGCIIHSNFEMLNVETFEPSSSSSKQICYWMKGLKVTAKNQCR